MLERHALGLRVLFSHALEEVLEDAWREALPHSQHSSAAQLSIKGFSCRHADFQAAALGLCVLFSQALEEVLEVACRHALLHSQWSLSAGHQMSR